MKRVMLASCLAFGLVVGLNAAPTLQTLTVNDDGKGAREVLGIFGNYQNINVNEAESGATTITFSVYTESLEQSESTTITVAPKTDGGYTVMSGEGAPQEAAEVWLFAGTYRGQNQSDSAWRGLYISGGHLERVFGGGYEETQKEVPTSALGLSVNLTVAGGIFGSVAGGSYNGGPVMETGVTGGDIGVLAANGMADADLTEEEIAKMPTPGTARLTVADRAGSSNKACDATVGIVYGGGCGGPVKTGSTAIELSAGSVGDVYLSGKEDSALSSTIGFTLGGATVTGTVRLFSPDLKAQRVNTVQFQIGDPDLVGDARIVLNGVAESSGEITVSRTGADEALDVYVEESLWRTDCRVSLSGGATATATAYRLVADGDDATFTVPEGVSLNVGKGTSLVIPSGMTVDNKGTVSLASGATAQFQGVLDEAALAAAQTVFTGNAGAQLTANGVTYGWDNAGWAAQTIAQIGDVTYTSLKEAFAAVPLDGSKTTIDVLGDVTVTETLTVPETAKVVLDLNGHTLSGSEALTGPVIANAGSLTLKTSGKASAIVAAGGAVIRNTGTLAGQTPATNGKLLTLRTTAEGAVAVLSEGGSVTLGGMTDSLIQGTTGAVSVTGGTLTVSSAMTLDGGDGPAVALCPTAADVTFKHTTGGATFTTAGGEAILLDGTADHALMAEVKSGTFTSTGAESAGLRVLRDEGEAVALTIDNGTVAFLKPLVAEGSDPVTQVVASASFAADALPDDALLADTVSATYPSTKIEGGTTYNDLSGAITAGAKGVPLTVTLIKNAVGEAGATLTNGRLVTVDLNGHAVAFAEGAGLKLDQSSLTLTGEGTLSASGNVAAITLLGSDSDVTEDCTHLIVGAGVTVKGQQGVLVSPRTTSGNTAYGVDVRVEGTIEAVDCGVNVNGSINVTEGNVPTITLSETSTVTATADDSAGIYAGGYAIWTLTGTVKAADALSVKCGDLAISGGAYTAFGALHVPPIPNTSGTENTGSALSITTIPDSVFATKTEVAITGGTFTSANGYALYEGVAEGVQTDATSVVLAISGEAQFNGGEAVTADIAITQAANKQVVSGGTFATTPDTDYLAPGFVFVQNANGTIGVAEGAYVAEVNGAKFLSLAEAFAAAKEGATIVLLADIADQADVYVREGQTLTLDLNGHTLGLAKDCSLNLLYGGSLNLIGSGAVKHTGKYGAIYIYGATKDAPEQICVNIGPNVTVESEGNNAIAIADTNGLCYGLVLNVEGTLKGQCGVNISGNIQETEANVPVITLAESSKIVAEGVGIYAAGYAHWTLAGDVTGADALSIKSGTFSITSGDYFATGAFADPAEANGNGSENTGAAVSITTNDGYAKAPIEIAITGGTFTSTNGYAFYEGIAKKGDEPAAEASRAVIEIAGGTFKGSADNETVTFDVAITTAADKRVISGGVFSNPVPEELCAYGYAPVATPNAEGLYTVEHPLFTKVGVLLEDGTYTVYDSMYAALYDTKGVAQEGVKATVIVLEDTSLDSYFRVMAGQEVTLDLNGHVLTCTGGPGITYAIDWLGGDNATVAKPTITITDSSVGQTGVMRSEGAFLDGLVRMVGGTLNITGGRFVQAVDDPNAQYKDNIFVLKEGLRVAPEEGRTVEVSGGTVRIETGVDASTQALGTLIQGGTFHSVEGRPAIEVPYSTQGLVISGGSFEGEGEALRIGAPTTVTVTGGDFTADTILVADANATLVLNGGDFAGASIAAEGGTLAVGREVTDLSAATIGGFATLSLAGDLDIGANRMTATAVEATSEATVSVAATRDELEAGRVGVFAADAQGAVPANLSLALANLAEGQALAEAETVAVDGVVALTFTAVPEAVAAEGALLQAILPYLRSQGLHNVVSLSGATAGGSRPLSVAEMADVVAVFSGAEGLLSATTAEGGTALALAYDFGITGVWATDAGLVVTAQVRGAEGRSLAFAEEADFALVDAESGEPLEAEVARGASGDVVTFTVPLASVPDSDSLRLRVRVRAGVGND